MKVNKILLLLAALTLIIGFVLILKSNLWGMLLFVVACCLAMVAFMRMRDAAGYGNDDVFFNGVGGTGRQQTEVEKKK